MPAADPRQARPARYELSAEEKGVAARLLDAEGPEAVLREAAPKGDYADLLWRLLAAGAVPFSKAERPACETAGRVEPGLVWRAAARLGRAPIRSGGMLCAIQHSYETYPEAWEGAFDSLPPSTRDVVALHRGAAGRPVDGETRERVLRALAGMSIDGDHDVYVDLGGYAKHLGEGREAFVYRTLTRMTGLEPSEISTRSHVVREALVLAPWPLVTALVKLGRLEGGALTELLEARAEPAAELLRLIDECRVAPDWALTHVLLRRAYERGELLPERLDPMIAEAMNDRHGDFRVVAAVERLPAGRRAAVVGAIEGRPYTCAGLFRDAELDGAILDDIWSTIEGGVESSDYRHTLSSLAGPVHALVAAGAYGHGLLSRALERAKSIEERFGDRLAFAEYGAQVRFGLRRNMFKATAAVGRPELSLLMPGDDLLWVQQIQDVVGWRGGRPWGSDALDGLSTEDLRGLSGAWGELNWDGTIDTQGAFNVPHTPPPIEDRPWAELAPLVERTSYARLADGEEKQKSVSRLFRRPEGFGQRLALAETLLSRANLRSWQALRGLQAVMKALLPELIARGEGLTGVWEAVAYRLLERGVEGEVRALLARLPRAQAERLAARLADDSNKAVRAYGKAFSEIVREGRVRAPTDLERVERVLALARSGGGRADTRFYALLPRDSVEPDSPRRVAAAPNGLSEATRRLFANQKMAHIITLDLSAMPELRARCGYGDEVRALALFRCTGPGGYSRIVPLTADELAEGHAEGGSSYEIVPIDVPAAALEDDEGEGAEDLRAAIAALPGRALGEYHWHPEFVEGDNDDSRGLFVALLAAGFAPGVGREYVADATEVL